MFTNILIIVAFAVAIAMMVHASMRNRQLAELKAEKERIAKEQERAVKAAEETASNLEMMHEEAYSPSKGFCVTWAKKHAHSPNEQVKLVLRKGKTVVWEDSVICPEHAIVNDEGASMVLQHGSKQRQGRVSIYEPHGDLMMDVGFKSGISEYGFTGNQKFSWCAVSPVAEASATRGRIMMFGMPDCDRVVAFPDVRTMHTELTGRIKDIRLSDFHATLLLEDAKEVTCDLHGHVVG